MAVMWSLIIITWPVHQPTHTHESWLLVTGYWLLVASCWLLLAVFTTFPPFVAATSLFFLSFLPFPFRSFFFFFFFSALTRLPV